MGYKNDLETNSALKQLGLGRLCVSDKPTITIRGDA